MDDKLQAELKKQIEHQFRRGMYTAAYGLSGAIIDMISKLERKPKKRLADYQKTIAEIKVLCSTKLNNPDKKESE